MATGVKPSSLSPLHLFALAVAICVVVYVFGLLQNV